MALRVRAASSQWLGSASVNCSVRDLPLATQVHRQIWETLPVANRSYRVGILGATGAVGQYLVARLEGHPWFSVTEVVASDRSAGRPYSESARWMMPSRMPESVGRLTVKDLQSELDCDLLLSALDSRSAEAEVDYAKRGFAVISNSSLNRLAADVPLVIPEINRSHLQAIPRQREERGFTSGLLVTNPNCSTIGLALALKPLQDSFGLEAVRVVTMQAITGAGLDGISAAAIQDNVIPHIDGEEEKLEIETRKILGSISPTHFVPAPIEISAQCNRVPVLVGHLESVFVRLTSSPALPEFEQALADFKGQAASLELPSAPNRPVHLTSFRDRPQPRLDSGAEGGMAVVVGRVRSYSSGEWKFSVLVHNMVRGAAGAAILNAELLAADGQIRGCS